MSMMSCYLYWQVCYCGKVHQLPPWESYGDVRSIDALDTPDGRYDVPDVLWHFVDMCISYL